MKLFSALHFVRHGLVADPAKFQPADVQCPTGYQQPGCGSRNLVGLPSEQEQQPVLSYRCQDCDLQFSVSDELTRNFTELLNGGPYRPGRFQRVNLRLREHGPQYETDQFATWVPDPGHSVLVWFDDRGGLWYIRGGKEFQNALFEGRDLQPEMYVSAPVWVPLDRIWDLRPIEPVSPSDEESEDDDA